jgi:hypothetical protein
MRRQTTYVSILHNSYEEKLRPGILDARPARDGINIMKMELGKVDKI